MLDNIEAVIFDVDGTLIDSLWLWKQVDIDFLKNHSIEFPDDLKKEIEGLSFTDTAIYFKKRFNLSESIDEIKTTWTYMVKDYYSNSIKLKDGALEYVKHLKLNNYKLAIATSNFMELTIDVLKANNIFEYFDIIVTTCEVPRSKSFPDIYIETANRLNTSPSKCIVFEDTLSGVSGATLAGMKVVGVYDSLGSCTFEELSSVTSKTIIDFNDLIKYN